MTEQAAKALATTLGDDAVFPMPSSRAWVVTLERADGHLGVIEDQGGWVYQNLSAYEVYHREGDQGGILQACEWGEWDDSEEWARKLSLIIGSEEYWHSGGGIWLVFYARTDGRFAVIGSESGAIYANREQFEADEYENAENHIFV